MARAIDASELMAEIQACSWDSEQDKERAEDLVLGMPTLTPPNEWVSVEERLPEVYLDEEDIGIPFLVCGPYTKYPFRAFFAGTFWHDCFEPVEVTHWMPLPAPPDRRPPEGEA